jgi:SAM-dependent methyltransferase
MTATAGWHEAVAGLSAAGEPLAALRGRLAAAGLQEYCAVFNPLAPALAPWAERLDGVPEPLRTLVELFVLGREVPAPAAEAALGAGLTDSLAGLGLLAAGPGGTRHLGGLVLRFVSGYWLLTDRPGPNPVSYFGDDSIALLTRLAPRAGGSALDLCSGPGLQALHLSSFADRVTAVEINPLAAALARVNACLNGRQERIEVLCGDLDEPVRGRRFDSIAANPPFLPFDDDFPSAFVGHGGADGLGMTRRVLAVLPGLLAEGGTAQLIGSCVAARSSPRLPGELERWCRDTGLDAVLTVATYAPLAPGSALFVALVESAALAAGRPRAEAEAAFARSLEAQGADVLLAHYLLVTPGRGELRVIDVARPARRTMWFASGMARPDWLG